MAVIFLFSAVANGDVTFSNLGPNEEFQDNGWAIGDLNTPEIENRHLAFQFTAEVTGAIESVEVAVFQTGGQGNNLITLSIWDDNQGFPGDSLWAGETDPAFSNNLLEVFDNTPDSQQTLVAGESYWLSARSVSSNASFGWSWNTLGLFGPATADNNGGTNWEKASELEQAAFRVNVTVEAIPEPSILLPLIVLGAFAMRRSRLNFSCHI